MTQQLVAAGQILGVRLYDHIIVAGQEYFSFRAEGMLMFDDLVKRATG